MNNTAYRKALWVELIAFDNRAEDMGVQAYLDNLGLIPDTVSIFMWGPDFVHLHNGLETDGEFPVDIGAYMDPYFDGPKKSGPPWTKFQLKRLIREFQLHGVKVLFSIFPLTLNNKFHQEWAVNEHPEVGYRCIRSMQPADIIINPLRRMSDGRFYEDFLLEKVSAVLRDYGFDGWHLADGYNHSWFQLCHADYSDDMIEQFRSAMRTVSLPEKWNGKADHDPVLFEERAQYIYRELRQEWIKFHRMRYESYLEKIVKCLHSQGKIVSSNTCWTRDPVEAIYRYGIDYRRLPEIGIDFLVIETCSAMGELLDCACQAHFPLPFFNVIKGTSLLTKAYAPAGKYLFNCCTQDITEGWSSLRHAPAFLEREILSYSNFYLYDRKGKPERCFEGLQICLAADIEDYEWRRIFEKADLGFAAETAAVEGVTLLWSDEIVEAELQYYLKTRNSLTANIFYNLLANGMNCDAVARIDNLAEVDTPLLVINPGLLPEEQQEKIRAYRKHQVFLVGNTDGDETQMKFEVWNRASAGEPDYSEPVPSCEADDIRNIPEPKTFFHEQFYRALSPEFYRHAVSVINAATAGDIGINREFNLPDANYFRLTALKLADGTSRYLVGNVLHRYILGAFLTTCEVESMSIANGFRGRPLYWEPRRDGKYGIHCELRIPPHGIGVVDVVRKT